MDYIIHYYCIFPICYYRVTYTLSGEGDGRYGTSNQTQGTAQKSRLYLVIVGETIGGKVDTAEAGGGVDYKFSTVSPYKIDPLTLDAFISWKLK